jgi:hypothetical protein
MILQQLPASKTMFTTYLLSHLLLSSLTSFISLIASGHFERILSVRNSFQDLWKFFCLRG